MPVALMLTNLGFRQLDGLSKTMDRVVEHLAELQPFLAEIRTLLKESLAKSDGGWEIKSPITAHGNDPKTSSIGIS